MRKKIYLFEEDARQSALALCRATGGRIDPQLDCIDFDAKAWQEDVPIPDEHPAEIPAYSVEVYGHEGPLVKCGYLRKIKTLGDLARYIKTAQVMPGSTDRVDDALAEICAAHGWFYMPRVSTRWRGIPFAVAYDPVHVETLYYKFGSGYYIGLGEPKAPTAPDRRAGSLPPRIGENPAFVNVVMEIRKNNGRR